MKLREEDEEERTKTEYVTGFAFMYILVGILGFVSKQIGIVSHRIVSYRIIIGRQNNGAKTLGAPSPPSPCRKTRNAVLLSSPSLGTNIHNGKKKHMLASRSLLVIMPGALPPSGCPLSCGPSH